MQGCVCRGVCRGVCRVCVGCVGDWGCVEGVCECGGGGCVEGVCVGLPIGMTVEELDTQ